MTRGGYGGCIIGEWDDASVLATLSLDHDIRRRNSDGRAIVSSGRAIVSSQIDENHSTADHKWCTSESQ